jgi:hypothetical protein
MAPFYWRLPLFRERKRMRMAVVRGKFKAAMVRMESL